MILFTYFTQSVAKSLKDVISKGKTTAAKGKGKPKFAKKTDKPSTGASPEGKKAAAPKDKKVFKSNKTAGSTGTKPKSETSGDKEGQPKKKHFKPKPKAKKPMTPEERKMAKPHYKLVSIPIFSIYTL